MKREIYTKEFISAKPQHLYIAPTKHCKDVVAHYTILHPTDEIVDTLEFRILPDASGCLIFQGEHSLDYWGPMQELVVLENDANVARRRFFVEFHPGGLYAISGQSLASYKNKREAFSKFHVSLAKELQTAYEDSENYDEFVDFLNHWIAQQAQKHPIPDRVQCAIQRIDERNGNIVMEALAKEMQLSLRQMRRDFAKYIGLSPKEYAQVVRINTIVKELSKDALVATALQGGYFDQAHFNKMFKQMLHVNPTSYFENIQEFYREIYKF